MKKISKQHKQKMQRKTKIDTISVPTADNAKWMGIGFLVAVVIVLVALSVVMHIR